MSTLEVISKGNDKEKRVDAKGLLAQVKSFQFLVSLVVFNRILTCTKGLSDHLQNPEIDLVKTGDLVLGTICTLEEFRSDEVWEHTFEYAEQVAKHLNIASSAPAQSTRSRQRSQNHRLEDYVIMERTGSREVYSSSESYKIHFYYSVLDTFIAQLKHRFTRENLMLMKAIQACSPQSQQFLEPEELKHIVELYELNKTDVMIEAVIAQNTLQNYGCD